MYDVDKIVNEKSLHDVISKHVTLKKDGNEYRGLCPFHQEKTPSFTVVPTKGYYHCHGCGAHGSVVDFVKEIYGVGFREACNILEGEEVDQRNIVEKKAPVKEIEDPYAEFKPVGGGIDFKEPKFYNPKRKKWWKPKVDAVYPYCTKDGSVIGYVIRTMVQGKKITPAIQMCEHKGHTVPCLVPFNKPRPLYKLEKLKDKGTIYIVEGEKAADALELVLGEGRVISWMMGTKNVDKSNWDSLPEGRDYILIPDADYKKDKDTDVVLPFKDQIGYQAMAKVKELLPNPNKVFIVNTHKMGEVKDGWDVADEEFTKKTFKDWLDDMMGRKKEVVEVQYQPEKKDYGYDDTYFKCLGFVGNTFYFYQNSTGQVYAMTSKEMSKSQMIMLAPLTWWETFWPKGKGGTDWDAVLDTFLRVQEDVGIFDSTCIRGRGAWIDKGRSVLHLGDKVVVDGVEMSNDEVVSNYIYMKSAPLSLDYGSYLPCEESKRLIDVCRLARWKNKSHADLLVGWMFASLVCGAMPFRSHIYLTGESGSGKSWVMENIIAPVMGKMPVLCTSSTTEAGIRKQMNNDVRPVIFNETEAESQNDLMRLQGVFNLARGASDENAAPILKGSGDGESFICRSSFLFASINKSTTKHADENRTIFLELAGSPKNATQEVRDQDNRNFKALEKACDELVDREFIGSLLTRAVQLVPIMRKNHQIFSDVGARVTGSRRLGSSLAMPLCGLYGLMNDSAISEEDATKLIKKYSMEAEKNEITETQEEECLDVFKYSEIPVEDTDGYRHTLHMAEIVDIVSSPAMSTDGFSRNKLSKKMKARGVMIEDGFVYLSNKKSSLPYKLYERTQFVTGWREAILRLEGVEAFSDEYFCSTLRSGGIKIPLELIVTKKKDLFGKELPCNDE